MTLGTGIISVRLRNVGFNAQYNAIGQNQRFTQSLVDLALFVNSLLLTLTSPPRSSYTYVTTLGPLMAISTKLGTTSLHEMR